MAVNALEGHLRGLNLNDPEHLAFRPRDDVGLITFEDIPRYLFRIFTPKSQGTTDSSWTRSMDARRGAEDSDVDIFARDDKTQVAAMLNAHLRWMKSHHDNLVSWTSSILFALVYIFHLHANITDQSTFDNIFLCVIDASKFPSRVFVRDMDLINAYSSFDGDLQEFKNMRVDRRYKQGQEESGYYFGEYLSQGALKIEGKCQIVSAQSIIDHGLYDIRPELETFGSWEPRIKPPWAIPVAELREKLYHGDTTRLGVSKGLDAALSIARNFDQQWRLPIAQA